MTHRNTLIMKNSNLTDTTKQNYTLETFLLTPEDVVRLLKVNRRTVYCWVEKGLISYVRINKKPYVLDT